MQARTQLINEQSIARSVLAEQIKMLMAQLPTSIVMGFLLASFVALVFNGLVTGKAVSVWWLVICCIFLLEYLLYIHFSRQNPQDIDYYYWLKIVFGIAGVTGVAWSVGLTLMLDSVAEQYHIFLIILLISLAASGITLAIRTLVYCVFQLGVLLPAITWMLFQEEVIHIVLGVFLLIFMVAMWVFAHQVSRSLSGSFKLQLENLSLANSLKQTNARLHVLNEELTQLSATDSLTQVANRRYFDNRFISEFSRANREDTSLALIMIDVDCFKAYNDEYGHVAGDECLKKIALCIRDSLKRPTDLVARYGGEEFVVLLPSTTIEGAELLAQEIRHKVEELKVTHNKSSVSSYVTVSLGVTGSVPGKEFSKQLMLKKADEALYNAKAAGRNKVCCETIPAKA